MTQCCSPQTESPSTPGGGFKLSGDLIRLVIAGFIAGNSTLVALVANLIESGNESESLGAGDAGVRWWFQTGLLIATVIVAALLLPQLAKGLWVNIQRRRISVDVLFAMGCVGAMWFSMRSYLSGVGPVYFEVVSILLFIYCLGGWVKGVTQQRVWTTLDAWSPEQHRCQRLEESGAMRWVLVKDIEIGDRVQVASGAMVPIDGVVERGEAFLRTSTITGEPHVVPVGVGDSVLASSVVVDAPLVIRANAMGDQRSIDQLTRSVMQAAESPSRWETQADWVAKFFAPTVATIAIATFVVWVNLSDVNTALMNALAVLLVACPCAFGFATPVSIWATVSLLAKQSMALQRNDAIERLASVDTVVFDKTGTLTIVEQELVGLHVAPEAWKGGGRQWRSSEILQVARSLESGSSHPIARAFLGDLENVSGELLPVRDFENIPAIGVRGKVDVGAIGGINRDVIEVAIGRLERLPELRSGGVSGLVSLNDPWHALKSEAAKNGHQLLGIEIDGTLVGVAVVGERSIDTLEAGLAKMKALGLEIEVLSGDQIERVNRLGIEKSRAGATPEEKAEHCRQLERDGKKVLFVGDGTNDAIAMTSSSASIAIAEGSALATEAADMVWHGHDLNSVADSIVICRQSVQTLSWTLRFAITYNCVGMLIAATGWLHPVAAAVLMLGSSLTVVLRASQRPFN